MRFGRDRQHPGALPVDVEPQPLDIGLHAVQVVSPHRLELVDFLGPAGLSVRQAVGEAGVDEAAVAARRRPSHPFGVDEHDSLVRIALCGMQCRPQPGVTRPDHQQVCGDGTRQLGVLAAAACPATSSRRRLPQATVRPDLGRRGNRTPSAHRGHYGVGIARGVKSVANIAKMDDVLLFPGRAAQVRRRSGRRSRGSRWPSRRSRQRMAESAVLRANALDGEGRRRGGPADLLRHHVAFAEWLRRTLEDRRTHAPRAHCGWAGENALVMSRCSGARRCRGSGAVLRRLRRALFSGPGERRRR